MSASNIFKRYKQWLNKPIPPDFRIHGFGSLTSVWLVEPLNALAAGYLFTITDSGDQWRRRSLIVEGMEALTEIRRLFDEKNFRYTFFTGNSHSPPLGGAANQLPRSLSYRIKITTYDSDIADLNHFVPIGGTYLADATFAELEATSVPDIEGYLAKELGATHGFPISVRISHYDGRAIHEGIPSYGSFIATRVS